MKNAGWVVAVPLVLATLGCARVRVEGPKEPIKLDVSMRLDIYQHVQRDIDDIESIVNGQAQKAKVPGAQSMLSFFVPEAYAQEVLGTEVEDAARRRGDRKPVLDGWMSRGVVGENKIGLLEIRSLENATAEVEENVKAENSDRMVIYHALAKKNGTLLAEVQKIYAKKLQSAVPSGTPVQGADEVWGNAK